MAPVNLKWIRETVTTADAPAAVGPYSQAVCAGPLVFCSAQLGLIPGKKEFAGTTVAEQTRQVMENLAAILENAGSSLEMILKTTVYLDDIADFPEFNEVYGSFFDTAPPARATFQARALPLGALVMIEAIALRD